MKLQEYFNAQYPKSLQVIKWEKENTKLEGEELIIEDYNNLESICIDKLPQLKTLIIKNCGKLTGLELDLNQNIEISLIGDFPLLKSYKIKQIEKQPTIIYQEKNDKGFCWGCALNTISLIGLVVLTGIIIKLSNKINELRGFIKELQNRLKLK